MKNSHLSTWEQEEYVIHRPTPEMLRHVAECATCRAAVARLEYGITVFRGAAVEWSAECLRIRPQTPVPVVSTSRPMIALRWAVAAALPLLLLALALLPWHMAKPHPAQTTAQISDDALLEQVDEQLSEAVPSSMESLTHLVSAQGGTPAAPSRQGSKQLVHQN